MDPSASRIIKKRNWELLDIAAFKSDLRTPDVLTKPIVGCNISFYIYDSCIRTLVDKHGPLRRKTA